MIFLQLALFCAVFILTVRIAAGENAANVLFWYPKEYQEIAYARGIADRAAVHGRRALCTDSEAGRAQARSADPDFCSCCGYSRRSPGPDKAAFLSFQKKYIRERKAKIRQLSYLEGYRVEGIRYNPVTRLYIRSKRDKLYVAHAEFKNSGQRETRGAHSG